MKKVFYILTISLALFLSAGISSADIIFNYNDDYANWPGYPQSPPYTVLPYDQIGLNPTVSGATITVDDNFYLKSINMLVSNLRATETLFINTMWDRTTPYDQWDYLAKFGGEFYEVSSSFTPSDYILVPGPLGGRIGHPYSIDGGVLTAASGLESIQAIPSFPGATNLIYTFSEGAIQLYDANTGFVVGFSGDCGNDVFLTPVPEPITMLLLGLGLVGIAGMRRKFHR